MKTMNNTIRTDFLIPEKSFFSGLASIFGINGGAKFNTSASDFEADQKAITNDWQMVGQDIRNSMRQLSCIDE